MGKYMVNQEIVNKLVERKIIEGNELAELFMDIVNSCGNRSKSFAEVVTGEHRYLQQEAFNMFFACIQNWAKAKEEDRYDLRNEYAAKASKVMIDALKNNGLW